MQNHETEVAAPTPPSPSQEPSESRFGCFDVAIGDDVKGETLQDVLTKPPVVLEVNEFNDEAARAFEAGVAKALASGQPVLPILIDSNGGSVYALNRMLDSVKNARKRGLFVVTIASGRAMSCGALLFASGNKRYVGESSIVMIHDVSSMAWGKTAEMVENAKHTEFLNKRGYAFLDDATGQPAGYWEKRVHDLGRADLFLSADDCLSANLATNLGLPKFNITVSSSYSLDNSPFNKRK